MSLYGALFSGVAGLTAQANTIGAISDNTANVNTVGYKSVQGLFETLVTNSGTVAYSPGGVLGRSRSSVSLQGLLQTTNSNTDVAISGAGFFVVNSASDGSGTVAYTRAGSFRQDSTGNFQNAAGQFLQGWPLDRNGLLPGEPGNANSTSSSSLTSVETINVSSFTGSAAATTSIVLSANLNAARSQLAGASQIVDTDANSIVNNNITASDIIVPGTTNGLARGDRMVLESGNGLSETLRYGGFTFSKNITSGIVGDSGQPNPTSPITLGNNPLNITNGDNTVTVRHANHGLTNGEVVTLSGVTVAAGGVPASDFNQSFVITVISEDSYSIEVATTPNANVAAAGGLSVQSSFRQFVGNILDASTAAGTFLGTTGTAGFSEDALSFTITTATVGTATFSYQGGTPNTTQGQFNNLTTLAAAISSTNGLSARIVNNQLYISGNNANEAITFANGSNVATGSGGTLSRGIDWLQELGIANVDAGTNRFSTLQGLANVVNSTAGFSATVTNPGSASTIAISVDDPLDTITIRDQAISTASISFAGSESPIGTTIGSNDVTITHSAAHGFSSGDIVTLDATSMANYPVARTYDTATLNATTTHFETTNASATVNVVQTAHGFTTGDQVFIDVTGIAGYPVGTVNGIPISEFQDLVTVTVLDADNYTFTTSSAATSTGDASISGSVSVSPTIAGIPLTDFTGSFEISNVTSTSYQITVANVATATAASAANALSVGDPSNGGSLTAELGLTASLNGGAFSAAQTTGPTGPAYDASDATKNMASESITPQFPINIPIFDSLGSSHNIRVGFVKTGINTFAAEVYAVPASDVSSSFPNGQLASGTITFNGDGSLRSIDSALTSAISIVWENGAAASEVTVNWGTSGIVGVGLTDGITQFDSDDNLNFANQNGVPVGELIGVEIDGDGVVTARFSNGEEQNLYKIPLADFSNPDGLEGITGNVFTETRESGTVNLREPGSSGVGTLQSSALESSNVELAEQLTNMIIAQRSYQANTKVITTSDDLLEELNQTIR